jgi:hypothetical protein
VSEIFTDLFTITQYTGYCIIFMPEEGRKKLLMKRLGKERKKKCQNK